MMSGILHLCRRESVWLYDTQYKWSLSSEHAPERQREWERLHAWERVCDQWRVSERGRVRESDWEQVSMPHSIHTLTNLVYDSAIHEIKKKKFSMIITTVESTTCGSERVKINNVYYYQLILLNYYNSDKLHIITGHVYVYIHARTAHVHIPYMHIMYVRTYLSFHLVR